MDARVLDGIMMLDNSIVREVSRPWDAFLLATSLHYNQSFAFKKREQR